MNSNDRVRNAFAEWLTGWLLVVVGSCCLVDDCCYHKILFFLLSSSSSSLTFLILNDRQCSFGSFFPGSCDTLADSRLKLLNLKFIKSIFVYAFCSIIMILWLSRCDIYKVYVVLRYCSLHTVILKLEGGKLFHILCTCFFFLFDLFWLQFLLK